MQTDLVLGLTATAETEKLLTDWRNNLGLVSPITASLPPIIPLAYLQEPSSFENLRKIANVAWPICRFPDNASVIEENSGKGLILRLADVPWREYLGQLCSKSDFFASAARSDPGPIPVGPWFFLGQFAAIHRRIIPPLPPVIAGRIFRAPLLSMFRIRSHFSSEFDFLSWELLAQLRVKKSPQQKD